MRPFRPTLLPSMKDQSSPVTPLDVSAATYLTRAARNDLGGEMTEPTGAETIRIEETTKLYRSTRTEAERWAGGYGAIQHSLETQTRVFAMADLLSARGVRG